MFYTGSAEDVEKRLKLHNNGHPESLKNKGPFELIYKEEFLTRQDAYKREKQIKSYKGGVVFKRLIGINN